MDSIGRPTIYTPELAAHICRELAEGRSLRAICQDEGMPHRSTVYDWLDASLHGFPDQYARARTRQAEALVDEILEIADNTANDTITVTKGESSYDIPNHEWITRSKVRIDSRKWLAGKLAPKVYGESKQLDVTSGGQRITGIAIVDYTADDSAA